MIAAGCLIPSWDDHSTYVKCRFSAGLCSVDLHNLCEICRSSLVTWSRLRNHFVMPGRSPRTDEARNLTRVVSSSRSASLDGFSVHESRIYNRTWDLSLIRILEKWTWSWLLQQPPTQVAEVSIRQSLFAEPAIMTWQAPTVDIVLISGAHASPLGVTANQTTAPLLVAAPSFPPFTQGPINMLPGVSISHSGAPGMPPAPVLYSSIQSVSAPR